MGSRLVQIARVVGTIAVIAAVVGTPVAEYVSHRNGTMDRLYAEAAGYPPYFRSSNESLAAVKKLSTYNGVRATKLLLNIALSENPLAPQARDEAFKALRGRKDPKVAVELANLLQPYQGLGTRQDAGTALQYLPCNDECIRSILHYLERVWRGEPNYEDLWSDPFPDSESSVLSLKRDQKELYSELYSVLDREKARTLANLAEVYGLGSSDPSAFALDLVRRLGLHEACPYLLHSDNEIKALSAHFFNAPRQELESAVSALNCR